MASLLTKIVRRAGRPLHAFYYRFLFGRRSALARHLGAWVRAWEERAGMGDVPLPRESWDRQYRHGEWSFLREPDELARYSVIASYIHHLSPQGPVLDVGCGEGLLREQLSFYSDAPYTGIDLSEAAIGQAHARKDPGATFKIADAATYTPRRRYAAVVLSESLYYFREPLEVVDRYCDALLEGGLMVVSMFRSRRTDAILRALESAYQLVEKVAISHRKGTWVVAVLRPPSEDRV